MSRMPETSFTKFGVIPCPEEGSVADCAAQSEVLKTARSVCEFAQLADLQQSLIAEPGSLADDLPGASQPECEGDKAYNKGSYSNAINDYTQAIRLVNHKVIEGELLAKRSAAFAALSTELRFRPASAAALYGMDPLDLAKLALKDGQRVSELFPKHSEGYLRQAFAQFLLENYSQAEEVCLEGMRWHPQRKTLLDCLKLIQNITIDAQQTQWRAGGGRKRQTTRDVDDFECVLCTKLLCEPVTTPCGHSFCSQCLRRSLDHRNKCPFCRTVLHLTQKLPVSVTLKNIIQQSFPEEYKERLQEIAGLSTTSNGHTIQPLFVLTSLMPGEKMALNIFEPRYRLMVRRVMSGGRRFGMVRSSEGSMGVENVACECEVVECEALPDGRYYLEVVGRRRIRILELWEQDGYRVGKVESMKDDECADPDSVNELSREITSSMTKFLSHLQEASHEHITPQGSVLALLGRVSDNPMANDPETISFWVASLLPRGAPQRSKLLHTTSTKERLQWLQGHLEQLWEAREEWDDRL